MIMTDVVKFIKPDYFWAQDNVAYFIVMFSTRFLAISLIYAEL